MNNTEALRLLEEGAIFIFQDAPVGMEFGIDFKTWTTDKKFKGVKMIPPGPHFIYFNATNNHGDVAPRIGFMHHFSKGEFIIRKWDAVQEDVMMIDTCTEEIECLKHNLMELDQYLGAYPYDVLDKWKAISNHINDTVINKLTPENGYIRSAIDFVVSTKTNECASKRRWCKSRTEEERQEDLLPELVPSSQFQIRFTEMPLRCYPEGSSASEITNHCLDSSYSLTSMLSHYNNPLEFLGEIQFAFISFILGLNFEALEQWKKLVQLMCNCKKAIVRFSQMYNDFISVLSIHLQELPEDFLIDIVANNNVIYTSLREFFTNIETNDTSIDTKFLSTCNKFKIKISSKFGWNFSNLLEEEDDEAPTVVEL